MNNTEIIIASSPSPEQREHIFQLLDSLFPVGRAYFENRLNFDSAYDPATTWFATVNGIVASTAQIFPLAIRVGQAVIKVGGIGSVGTAPDFRGMGLAHNILQNQTSWMEQQGYDLGLLRAVEHAFYEKIGWQLIAEKCYSLELPSASRPDQDYEVIPFSSQYVGDLKYIYEQFNQNRTYTLVRSDAYWNDLISWPVWNQAQCLLLRKNDAIVAYGIIERKDNDTAFINELNYLPAAEAAMPYLLQALSRLHPNVSRILARLPEDHIIVRHAQYRAQEQPYNVSMWKMLNCANLLGKLVPELEKRLQQSRYAKLQLAIELHVDDELLYLHYDAGKLHLSVDAAVLAERCRIKLGSAQLIEAVIWGYVSAEHNETAELLQALFPKQNAAFYLTDKF